MAKLTVEQIAKLEAKGFNRWTKGKNDRLYMNGAVYNMFDIDVSRHNSGTIALAKLNGEEVSNNFMAKFITAAKNTYIDLTNGEVHYLSNDNYHKELIGNAINSIIK